jgi:putative heme-binding domain-containing protein
MKRERFWQGVMVGCGLVVAAMGMVSGQGTRPEPARAAAIAAGQRIFAGSCGMAYCHGSDGAGGGGPRLRDRRFTAATLTRVIREGVPGTSMPAFGRALSGEQLTQVVAFLLSVNREVAPEGPEGPKGPERAASPGEAAGRLDPHLTGGAPRPAPPGGAANPGGAVNPGGIGSSTVGTGAVTGVVGDWRAGQELFFDPANLSSCRVCHTLHGRGGRVAADLSRLSAVPAGEVLRRLLAPRSSDNGQHALVTLTLKTGERMTGILRDETDQAVRIFDTEVLPPVSRSYLRPEILRIERLDRSGCPGGYASRFTLQQLLDLIALIRTVDPARPVAVTVEELFR